MTEMIHDRHRGGNDGVGSWCKDCHHTYMKAYRLAHKINSQDMKVSRMKWRGLYEDKKQIRLRHCWTRTDQGTWIALCGLERESYLVLSQARGESKCPQCFENYCKTRNLIDNER
jgi:hypothetical protein